MRISFTRAEVDALGRAAGEVSAGEMELWTTDEAEALDSAHTKLTHALEGRQPHARNQTHSQASQAHRAPDESYW